MNVIPIINRVFGPLLETHVKFLKGKNLRKKVEVCRLHAIVHKNFEKIAAGYTLKHVSFPDVPIDRNFYGVSGG